MVKYIIRHKKKCKVCGTELPTPNRFFAGRSKYCSDKCANRADMLLGIGRKQRLGVRLKSLAINLYGGKCVRCGFSDNRALQFDHVSGYAGRKAHQISTADRYRNIIRLHGKGVFRLLCANCNWIKKFDNQEHPGMKVRKIKNSL